MDFVEDVYGPGAILTGIVTFIGIWIYAFSEWGLLIGLIFGWIPALIGGVLLGILWPLAVGAAAIIGFLLWNASNSHKPQYDTQKVNNSIQQKQCIDNAEANRDKLATNGLKGKPVSSTALNDAMVNVINKCKVDYPVTTP